MPGVNVAYCTVCSPSHEDGLRCSGCGERVYPTGTVFANGKQNNFCYICGNQLVDLKTKKVLVHEDLCLDGKPPLTKRFPKKFKSVPVSKPVP